MPGSSSKTMFQTFFQPLKIAYNFYHGSIRYVVNNPMITLTYISLIFTKDIQQAEAGKPCEAVMPVFNYPTTGSLESNFYSEFDIYANVKRLSDAKFILIGIVDNNPYQYETQNQLISYIGNRFDVIHFSGVYGNFACKDYCLISPSRSAVEPDSSKCLPLTPLHNKFRCQGWEKPDLARRLQENRNAFDEYKLAEADYKKLKKYNDHYLSLKQNISSVASDHGWREGSPVYQTVLATGTREWMLTTLQFLDVIDSIYRYCIPENYVEAHEKVIAAKDLLHRFGETMKYSRQNSVEIMNALNDISRQTEDAMLPRFLKFGTDLEKYHSSYDSSLTSAERVEQGLAKTIIKTKSHSGKKFFISPWNQYINGSAKFFSHCNMSTLNTAVYDSVKDRPFVALIFRS